MSAAKYTGDCEYTARGLDPNGKMIGSWCDDYDLSQYPKCYGDRMATAAKYGSPKSS